MKIRSLIGLIVLLCLQFNCASKMSDLQLRSEQKSYEEMKNLIQSRKFSFSAASAIPMQSNDIIEVSNNLLTRTRSNGTRQELNPGENFMIVTNDSINSQLSYFGELRTSFYNDSRNTNIVFNDKPYQYDVNYNDSERTILVKFKIKGGSENFNINMFVYPDNKAQVAIYSSNRTAIRYNGMIGTLANQ